MIKKLGEGTFSEVFKAQVVKTGEFVAVKCMKQKYTNIETVNSLREVRSLKRLSTHKNIISLLEVLL
jgi:renal tumor antigen